MKSLLLITFLLTLAIGCALTEKANDIVTARQEYKIQLEEAMK